MHLFALAFLALLAGTPVVAKPLTVRMGETWVFTVVGGQPANAQKATPATSPVTGQIKVTVQPLMGTTMTVTTTASSTMPIARP